MNRFEFTEISDNDDFMVNINNKYVDTKEYELNDDDDDVLYYNLCDIIIEFFMHYNKYNYKNYIF